MSEKLFLQTLQALLTMVDCSSPTSIACVKATLQNLFALAEESKKAEAITLRMMMAANQSIDYLIYHNDDFAGKPGDYNGNVARQHRLAQMLRPNC